MNEDGQNELALALEKAATEPASRPDFFRLLLESEIFVLGHTEARTEGRRTVAAGETLAIKNWQKKDGTPIIPFFTSLETLRRAIKEEQSYVALPARSLFEVTKGAALILNPTSNYAKEFLPHEIEALLTTGTNHVAQTRVGQTDAPVLLGQPADYPTAMISALTTLLARHSSVHAAYLCLMHDPSIQEKPFLVIGIQGEEDMERAMQEAGSVAADTAPHGQPVYLIWVIPGDKGTGTPIFESVKPFYERASGVKF